MIKLRTTRDTLNSVFDYKHDALVAHAYQEALAESIESESLDQFAYADVQHRVLEKLKSWGVE